MKKIIVLMAYVALCALCASASVIALDDFNYSIGPVSGDNGGTGFAGSWSGTGTVAAGSLSGGALPTSGNKLDLSNTTVTRTANFTDVNFNVNATNYITALVKKGGSGAASDENFKLDITASSGIITGFEIMSDENVKLNTRAAGFMGTEKIDVNATYLYLLKLVTSTSSEEQFYLTWYKAGDVIPQNDEDVTWKISATMANNGVSSNTGLRLTAGSAITASFDEFRIGTTLQDVVPEPATIGLFSVAGILVRFVRRHMNPR